MKEQVRSRASGAIARHAGFASVRIEDADRKVGVVSFGGLDDYDTIRAGAVMPITDAVRKCSQIADGRKLVSFEDEIVVSVAVEFGERWVLQDSYGGLAPKAFRKR